jgi:adenylate cyclase
MGKDQEGTLAALKAIRSELADPKIEEHRGRKTTGDGLLLEFASVVDAVRCAVEVQREMLRRNTEIPRRAGSAVVANYKAGTGSGSATCL